MSSERVAELRPFLFVCAIASFATVPIACAKGSTETDIGLGGAGGQAAQTTSTTTSSTGGFPSASSSTGGFPSASSSSSSGSPTTSSVSSSSGSPATSSSSSGGASSACDLSGDCGTCGACADNSVCFLEYLSCELDFDCPYIWDCVSYCDTQACFDSCLDLYPLSAQYFLDEYGCLVCSCQADCQVPAGTCQ